MQYLYHLSPLAGLSHLRPGFGVMPDGTPETFFGVYLTSAEFLSAWREALQEKRGQNLYLYQVEVSEPIPPWFFDRASGVPWRMVFPKPSPEIIYELSDPLVCIPCECAPGVKKLEPK